MSKDYTKLNYRSKEESEKDGKLIKSFTLNYVNEEQVTYEIDEGLVLISDSKDGKMISIMQGGPAYFGHSLNMLLAMIGASQVRNADIPTIYEFMHKLALRLAGEISSIMRTYVMMRDIMPTNKDEVN